MTLPTFPDGEPAPTEDSLLLLALFGGWLDRGVVHDHQLRVAMARKHQVEPTEAAFEAALQPLLARGFVDRVAPPTYDPQAEDGAQWPLQPLPREGALVGPICYAPTPLGRRAAFLTLRWKNPLARDWLRSASLEDQILQAIGTNVPHTIEEIEADCCTSSPTEIATVLASLVADGIVAQGAGNYALTVAGHARQVGVAARQQSVRKSTIKRITAKARTRATAWTINVTFVADPKLRAVLEKMIAELALIRTVGDLETAGIVLAGAIAEGVLYDALVRRRPAAMKAKAAPRNEGKTLDLAAGKWDFREYIAVANEIGILANETRHIADTTLRDIRNLVHPAKQVRDKLSPSRPLFDTSLIWLQAVVDEVRVAPLPADDA